MNNWTQRFKPWPIQLTPLGKAIFYLSLIVGFCGCVPFIGYTHSSSENNVNMINNTPVPSVTTRYIYAPTYIYMNSPSPTPTEVLPTTDLEETPEPELAPPPPDGNDVYYANCSEVRAAGAAPLYLGEPGYRKGLDRDGDGKACEK